MSASTSLQKARAKANTPEARARAAATRAANAEARDRRIVELTEEGLVPQAVANALDVSKRKVLDVLRARGVTGQPSSWEDIERIVIRKASGKCRRCGKTGTSAHHIKSREEGGASVLENLVCLCVECHNWVEENRDLNPSLKTRAGIEGSFPSTVFHARDTVSTQRQGGYGCPNDKINIWERWVEQGRKGGADLIEKYACKGCDQCAPPQRL
jgi:5-methylcytosine-specific restriction endonuclease McrA